jgi:hypothetical protein
LIPDYTLGYRKNKKGGVWCVRKRINGKYWYLTSTPWQSKPPLPLKNPVPVPLWPTYASNALTPGHGITPVTKVAGIDPQLFGYQYIRDAWLVGSP